ncbi:MAG TPA: beta-propeller fold lactonase family protein [Solirubrobacteraceae bacterium]|jgi:DNA-binding beta-propeller fold protein YncE
MRFGSFSSKHIALAASILAVSLSALPASAIAADGFGPLSGEHGCLVAPGAKGAGTSACGTGKGLRGARAVAVSPDGANVYVAGGVAGDSVAQSYGAVAILKRDPTTGAIEEVGCLSSDGTDGRDGASGSCTAEPSLLGASGVAVSPDGSTVYVSSSSSASVVAFSRDPATGALTRLGCFQGMPRPGAPCGAANLMSSASSPVVSADGSSLYVAAPLAGAVSTLDASDNLHTAAGVVPAAGTTSPSASASTTATTPPASAPTPTPSLSAIFTTSLGGDELLNSCIAVNGLDGPCAVGTATRGLYDLALSPDGKQLYGAAPGSHAIDAFAPAASGGLAETSCVKLEAPHGLCTSGEQLNEPVALASSPDGKNVYAADKMSSSDGGQLDVLTRNATTGALSASGCVQFAPKPEPEDEAEGEEESPEEEGGKKADAAASGSSCPSAAGLDSTNVVAVSGDGSSVYAIGSGAAAIFSRNATTGALSETSCAVAEDPRCTSLPAIEGVTDAAVSPDGRQVYVVASTSDAVMVFGIGAAVTSAHAAATRAGAVTVSVACPAGLRQACSGRVQLTRAIAHVARHGRRGAHSVHVRRVAEGASREFSIAPGRRAGVRVRLTSQMRHLLSRRHRLRLMAIVRANPSAGGSGYGRHVTLLERRR